MATTIISCTKSFGSAKAVEEAKKNFPDCLHISIPLSVVVLKYFFLLLGPPVPTLSVNSSSISFCQVVLFALQLGDRAEHCSSAGGIIVKCEESATCRVRLSASSFSPALLFLSTSHSKRTRRANETSSHMTECDGEKSSRECGKRDVDSEIKRLRSQF
jgi:hypothetical protein